MNSKKSLWSIPYGDESNDLTSNVKSLMLEQCHYLEEETSGVVKARFERMKSFEALKGALVAVSHFGSSLPDLDGAQRTDANELYSKPLYGFEIYTDSYKFKIMEVTLSPMYPIKIRFDGGVLEDTRDSFPSTVQCVDDGSSFLVSDDDELMDCFAAVVAGKKVRYILMRMIKQASDASGEA